MWPFRRTNTGEDQGPEPEPESEKVHGVKLLSNNGNLLGEWTITDDFDWDTSDGVYLDAVTVEGKELRIMVGQNTLVIEQLK